MASDGSNAMFGLTASGMPLAHLDFGYIGKCTDPSELEKIIKVLRSGEEGTYPQLTSFAEKQLESINPKSKVLRKDIPIQSYRDLETNERDELSDDFKDWISEISSKDSQLKRNCENPASNHDNLPPVRSSKTVGSTTLDDSQVSNNTRGKPKRSAAPRGYQDWDKFNPDEELKTLEEKEERELKTKREKAKINAKDGDLLVNVKTSGNSEAELTLLADREKDKGNEAFRCGDYKESLVYYTRSIQYKPTAASYNNRAFANLKLKNFQEAIDECNKVLELEPRNLKAFLRRALAHKGRGDNTSARGDLDKVLDIEPNNKRAQEIISEISAHEKSAITNDGKATGETKKKGKRMKIIEIDNDEEPAVEEEKQPIENNVEQRSSNSPAVHLTDGNCMSSSSKNTVNKCDISSAETGQYHEKNNFQSENKREENSPSDAVEKGHSENQENVVPIQRETTEHQEIVLTSPPPVLELPRIVVKSKDEGMSLYKLGRYAEASEKFTVAIELLEKDKCQYKSALSSLLNNRAACLQRIGDALGCIKDCTASLALLPGSIKPLLKRASCNEMLERYEESYLDFNKVTLMDPSNQTAMNGNSRVCKHLVNTYGTSWRERLSNVKVSETPRSSELLNAGESNKAEKTFNLQMPNKETSVPSKKVNVSSPNPVKDSLPTDHSKPFTRDMGQKKIQRDVEEENVERKFEQSKEKGNLFVKQGKLDQAVKCYTECIELDPSKVAVYTNRALCYLRLKKFILAEEDTTKALTIQDHNVKALYRRALARKELQKYDEAAKDLLNLIKIEPTNTSGNKELNIVLNLCREERKKKKDTNDSKNTVPETKSKKIATEVKSKSRVNEDNSKNTVSTGPKSNQTKPTNRRRVQIKEVNGVEDNARNSNSSSKKTNNFSSSSITAHDNKISSPAKPAQESSKPAMSASKDNNKKIKLHRATAFDFYQAWNSVKHNDLSCYADILRQLNPAMLPKVLSNKLDADMFRCIIGAVSEQLLPSGEDKLAFEILQYLCEAQRFDMVKMFLDSKDNKVINNLSTKLAASRTKNEFVDVDVFNGILKKYV